MSRNNWAGLALLCLMTALFPLTTGCGLFDSNPAGPEVGKALVADPNPAPSGLARVSFRLLLPQSSRAGLRDTDIPTVSFSLTMVNPGNIQVPTVTMTRQVDVDASGNAATTFQGIDLKPVIGRISIHNGNIGGISEFHGAADLVAGDNTIEVVASGSSDERDSVVRAIDALIASSTEISNLTTGLVGKIREIARTIGTGSASVANVVEEYAARNLPPTVEIVSPISGTSFNPGRGISLIATGAAYQGASVSGIEFFLDSASLGSVSASPFTLDWIASAPGAYSISAQIRDSDGRVGVSKEIAVTITGSAISGPPKIPPPANGTVVVDLGDDVQMLFREIKPGSFQMGEEDGPPDEKPVRTVTLSKGFLIGCHEVTQAQFKKLMGMNPSYFVPGQRAYGAGYYETVDHPVEQVSWFDAIRFCNALSIQQRLSPCYTDQDGTITIDDGDTVTCSWTATGYRLPTEGEWEYACRAGTTTKFSWGDLTDQGNVKNNAWYERNAFFPEWNFPHADWGGTQPVGTRPPNPWGLFDMHGNVWEWCWGRYDAQYYSLNETTDPRDSQSGAFRITRGGSWNNGVSFLRSAKRGFFTPTNRFYDIGFRPVRIIP